MAGRTSLDRLQAHGNLENVGVIMWFSSQRWSDAAFLSGTILIVLISWLAHLESRVFPGFDDIASIQCATGTYGSPDPPIVTLRKDYDRSITITNHSTFRECLEATSRDVHPPAFFLTLNLAMRCVDSPYLAGRTLSGFFGIAAIGVLYWILRTYSSPPFAAIGALFFGLASQMCEQMIEIRHYTLMAFANLVVLYLAVRISSKYANSSAVSKAEWGLLALAQALSMWTHYISVLHLSVVNLWLIIRCVRHRRKFLIPYAIALAISILLFSLWLPWFGNQLHAGNRVLGAFKGWDDARVSSNTGQLAPNYIGSFVWSFLRVPGRFPLLLWVTASLSIAGCGYYAWK